MVLTRATQKDQAQEDRRLTRSRYHASRLPRPEQEAHRPEDKKLPYQQLIGSKRKNRARLPHSPRSKYSKPSLSEAEDEHGDSCQVRVGTLQGTLGGGPFAQGYHSEDESQNNDELVGTQFALEPSLQPVDKSPLPICQQDKYRLYPPHFHSPHPLVGPQYDLPPSPRVVPSPVGPFFHNLAPRPSTGPCRRGALVDSTRQRTPLAPIDLTHTHSSQCIPSRASVPTENFSNCGTHNLRDTFQREPSVIQVPFQATQGIGDQDENENACAQPEREVFTCSEEQAGRVMVALHLDFQQPPCARDPQLHSISSFLKSHVEPRQGGALYCQGQPGTGKTLCVTHVVKKLQDNVVPGTCLPSTVFVTGMSLLAKGDNLFQAIWDSYTQRDQTKELSDHTSKSRVKSRVPASKKASTRMVPQVSAAEAYENISALFCPAHASKGHVTRAQCKSRDSDASCPKTAPGTEPMLLVVLDEVDRLVARDAESVKTLMAMTASRGSRLMVVAISNVLGLPAKEWSQLLKDGLEITTVDFSAYTAQQLEAIIADRLACFPFQVFDPKAIKRCAHKCDLHGDVREVLSACQAALNLLRDKVRQDQLHDSHFLQGSGPATRATSRVSGGTTVGTTACPVTPRAPSQDGYGTTTATATGTPTFAPPAKQQLVTAGIMGEALCGNAPGFIPVVAAGQAARRVRSLPTHSKVLLAVVHALTSEQATKNAHGSSTPQLHTPKTVGRGTLGLAARVTLPQVATKTMSRTSLISLGSQPLNRDPLHFLPRLPSRLAGKPPLHPGALPLYPPFSTTPPGRQRTTRTAAYDNGIQSRHSRTAAAVSLEALLGEYNRQGMLLNWGTVGMEELKEQCTTLYCSGLVNLVPNYPKPIEKVAPKLGSVEVAYALRQGHPVQQIDDLVERFQPKGRQGL